MCWREEESVRETVGPPVTSEFVLAIYGPGLGRLSVRLIIVNSNITAPDHNTQQDLLLSPQSQDIFRAVSVSPCQKVAIKMFWCHQTSELFNINNKQKTSSFLCQKQIKKAKTSENLGRWVKVQIPDLCYDFKKPMLTSDSCRFFISLLSRCQIVDYHDQSKQTLNT